MTGIFRAYSNISEVLHLIIIKLITLSRISALVTKQVSLTNRISLLISCVKDVFSWIFVQRYLFQSIVNLKVSLVTNKLRTLNELTQTKRKVPSVTPVLFHMINDLRFRNINPSHDD